ncbi:MAG: hypothetical protein RMK17_01240 [bacterium]|nr:hypothetical protein [bacterium]
MLIVIASWSNAQSSPKVALLGGGMNFWGNKTGKYPPQNISPSSKEIRPNFELRLFPRAILSGGIEYFKMGLLRPEQKAYKAYIFPGEGEGFFLIKNQADSRFVGGNLYLGGGKTFRIFGIGTIGKLNGEITTSYELHGWFRHNPPPNTTETFSKFVYGGGAGIGFSKKHFWMESGARYLHPIKVVATTIKLGVVF